MMLNGEVRRWATPFVCVQILLETSSWSQSFTLPSPRLLLVLNCLPRDIVKPELGVTHSWVLLVKVVLRTGQGILLTSVCRKPTGPTLISWCRCCSWAGQWVLSESPLKATCWTFSEMKTLKETVFVITDVLRFWELLVFASTSQTFSLNTIIETMILLEGKGHYQVREVLERPRTETGNYPGLWFARTMFQNGPPE